MHIEPEAGHVIHNRINSGLAYSQKSGMLASQPSVKSRWETARRTLTRGLQQSESLSGLRPLRGCEPTHHGARSAPESVRVRDITSSLHAVVCCVHIT